MSIFTFKEKQAILYAPLTAGLSLYFLGIIREETMILEHSIWMSFLAPFFSILLAAPQAYLFMFFLGIPTYLLLKWLKIDNFVTISLSGLVWGLLIVYYYNDFDSFYPKDPVMDSFVLGGFFVSTTAAYILRDKTKTKNY